MELRISKCVLCGEKGPRKGLAFFKFPHRQARFNEWMKELLPVFNSAKIDIVQLKKKGRICANHFKEKDFTDSKKNSLVADACPTMDIQIDNNKTIVGEMSHNETHEVDTFQCGRCKSQFQLLSEFISHKKFQCDLNEAVKIFNEINEGDLETNDIPALNNSGIDNCNDELLKNSSQETENKVNEKVSIVVEGNPSKNFSFVVNDDGSIVGNLVEFPTLAGQVILTSNASVDGGPILLKNSVGDLILASNEVTNNYGGEIVITCPVKGLKLAPQAHSRPSRKGSVNQIVPTSKVLNCSIENDPTGGVVLTPDVLTCLIQKSGVVPTAKEVQNDSTKKTLPASKVTSEALACSVESLSGNTDALADVDSIDEIVLPSEILKELEANESFSEALNYFALKPTFKPRPKTTNSNNKQRLEPETQPETEQEQLKLYFEQKLVQEPELPGTMLEQGKGEEQAEWVGEGEGQWEEEEEQDENKEKTKRRKCDKKEPVSNKRARLSCSYCGKPFDKAFNLAQHERTHTGERPFQCIICGRAFTQKSNVRKHMVRHKVFPHGKLTLKGQNNKNSAGRTLLENGHSYSCPYCTLTFDTYSQHKKHLASHSDRKVYRCIQSDCNAMFRDLDDYLSHSKQHSTAEFQCHVCLKMFYNLDELGAHQYDHDASEKDKDDLFNGSKYKVKCQVCHSRFQTVESLKHHMAIDSHHYECGECKSVFHSERFLRRHLSIHADPNQLNFECPHCHKKFRTQKFLDNHLFVHVEEKPFACEHCNKKFSSKYRLKRHLAIHLNQYYECPFKGRLGCSKTFYRKDKLRDHVSTHNHLRLHVCQFCSKTYSSTATLNYHMRRHHKVSKEDEAFKCMRCGLSFKKKREFLRHGCVVVVGKGETETDLRETEDEVKNAVANIEIIMVPCIPTIKTRGK